MYIIDVAYTTTCFTGSFTGSLIQVINSSDNFCINSINLQNDINCYVRMKNASKDKPIFSTDRLDKVSQKRKVERNEQYLKYNLAKITGFSYKH